MFSLVMKQKLLLYIAYQGNPILKASSYKSQLFPINPVNGLFHQHIDVSLRWKYFNLYLFHQLFKSSFCANILAPKSTTQNVSIKKLHAKCNENMRWKYFNLYLFQHHFTSSFCTNILLSKKYKPKM
jgi:hypothetical protein